MVKRNLLNKLFFIFCISLFVLYENAELISHAFSKMEMQSSDSSFLYRILLFLLCGGFCTFYSWPKMLFSRSFITFILFFWIVSLFGRDANIFGQLVFSTELLLPLVMFVYFYNVAQFVEKRLFIITIAIASILIFSAIWKTYQIELFYSATDVRPGSLYLYLFLAPLFLLSNNNIIKWGSLFIVAIAMVFSLKRGGFISFGVAFLVYYVVNTICNKGKIKIKLFISMLLVLIGLFFVFYKGLNQYYEGLVERLSSMVDDGGSGRDQVYETTWNMIVRSDVSDLLFGHGWNMVVENSPMGLSAHNDFMEVLYDFGIFALVLYIFLYYNLYKTMFKLVKKHSDLAAPFAFSLMTFTVNSMIAHIVIYPFNFIVYSLVWGYMFGNERQNTITVNK